MIFLYNNKKYLGKTAAQIIRDIVLDTPEYENQNGTIQEFLSWSLERMADRIPQRDLDVSANLSDETISFNYLCLLDSYGIGNFYDTLSPASLSRC